MLYLVSKNKEEFFMLNKKGSIDLIKKDVIESDADVEIIKASIKNGGGLLRVLPDQSFQKIMLRRSRNYSDPTIDVVNEEDVLKYSFMTWFTVDADNISDFDYLLFFMHDEKKDIHYSFIFTIEEFKSLMKNKTFGKRIDIYIQQIRATNECVITRLGQHIDNTPINVTKNLNNWRILEG